MVRGSVACLGNKLRWAWPRLRASASGAHSCPSQGTIDESSGRICGKSELLSALSRLSSSFEIRRSIMAAIVLRGPKVEREGVSMNHDLIVVQSLCSYIIPIVFPQNIPPRFVGRDSVRWHCLVLNLLHCTRTVTYT